MEVHVEQHRCSLACIRAVEYRRRGGWGSRGCSCMAGFANTGLRLARRQVLNARGLIRRCRLRNVIERASIVCEDGSIRPEDLPVWSASSAQVDSTELDAIERRAIERVMRETHGNKVQASQRLGISRMQLYCRLRKYGLEGRVANPLLAGR